MSINNPQQKESNLSIETISDLSTVENIIDSYGIQLLEEERRNKGELKLQYYFDTFDVVNLIRGGLEYTDLFRGFNREKYEKEELQNLVYAFVFQGVFKNTTTIRMLEPHKLEFTIKSSSKEGMGGLNEMDREDLINNALTYLNSNFTEIDEVLKNKNSKQIIQKLIKNTPAFFTINFLLEKGISWQKRLKHLRNEKILSFDKVENEFELIEDAELFKTISEGFKSARDANADNNLYDSLAFYHLQKLLDKHIDDPANNPLPVFLESTPTVKKAIQNINEVNPKLFSYPRDKDNPDSQRIPIVRGFLFFALEPIFSTNLNVKNLFENLDNSRPILRNLIEEEYIKIIESSRNNTVRHDLRKVVKHFEYNISNLIKTKFTQEIWLKEEIYLKLIDQLQEECLELIEWTKQENLTIGQNLEDELKEILGEANAGISRTRRLTTIIKAFDQAKEDVNDAFLQETAKGKLDIFKDFALMKFGIDPRVFPRLQDFVESLMIIENLSYDSPELNSLLSNLSVKKTNDVSAKNFLKGIVVAWMLGKYNLIIELCDPFDNDFFKDQFSVALIYAAAKAEQDRSKKGEEKVKEIIDCVLSVNKNNYKVWIGVAYLYNRLWEYRNKLYHGVPEMDLRKWRQIKKNPFYKSYFEEGTYKYILQAHDILKIKVAEEKEKDGENYHIYLSYYLYALNNVIYYTAKNGAEKQFKNLHEYVKDFLIYEEVEAVWQGRFYDTLGWYSLRSYYYIQDNPKLKGFYLERVLDYLDQAKKRMATRRDRKLYKQLEEAVFFIHSP